MRADRTSDHRNCRCYDSSVDCLSIIALVNMKTNTAINGVNGHFHNEIDFPGCSWLAWLCILLVLVRRGRTSFRIFSGTSSLGTSTCFRTRRSACSDSGYKTAYVNAALRGPTADTVSLFIAYSRRLFWLRRYWALCYVSVALWYAV